VLAGLLLAAVLPGPGIAWIAAGLVASTAVALRWERRLNTTLLLRIYGFVEGWAAGRIAGIDARVDQLTTDIAARLADPEIDEVLLVGFSVGSLLAASAAARLQARAGRDGALDRFALVTLGNCIPLLGMMPAAGRFRSELAQLRQPPPVRWIDFSSVTDWVSFAAVDPLDLCLGPATASTPYAPLLASPRFHTMFDRDEYAAIVKDKRRMHLQYLMAGRKPAAYDYFAITAGPRRLADRVPDFQAWR
jgi:pimeloyl-ACP methyl ester carboxylesterase